MKLYGLDEKFEIAHGMGVTTIREQHQKGKVRPGKDTAGHFAEIDRANYGYASFRISEADFKALCETSLGGT
jgi:hypothetical protein